MEGGRKGESEREREKGRGKPFTQHCQAKSCPHTLHLLFDAFFLLQKTAFKDACCCLFIFDIIYFNGETLMDK